MGLESALATLRTTVDAAIANAGITQRGQVILGWPTATQIVEILGQSDAEWQITLYPLSGTNETRWIGERGYVTMASAATWPLTASIGSGAAQNVLTFAGTVGSASPLNVHAFVNDIDADAFIQATTGQTPAQVAVAMAAAFNGLGFSGGTASASGNSVVLPPTRSWRYCNIGGSQSVIGQPVMRIGRIVQVTIWATGDITNPSNPDSSLRLALYDAIVGAVGVIGAHFITLSDGSSALVRFVGDAFDDDSQSSYSLFIAQIKLYMEYDIFSYFTATQVGDVAATTSSTGTNYSQSLLNYIGGP